jgi:hypothetical protein
LNLKQKLLNIEESKYTSKLSAEQLITQITNQLEDNSLGLSGRLTSDNEFTIHDKMIVIGWSMPNLKRKSAYAYGKLTKINAGTLITLSLRPNSILPLFAIVAILGGIIFTSMLLILSNQQTYYLAFGIGLIVLGFIYYPLSTLLRNRLRKKIETLLNLTRQ